MNADSTLKWTVVGAIVIASLIGLYHFVFQPIFNQNKLEDCLSNIGFLSRSMTGEDLKPERRQECYEKYGS
jgi:hypothetical protein